MQKQGKSKKKIIIIAVIAVFVMGGIASMGSGGSDTKKDKNEASTQVVARDAPSEENTAPQEPQDTTAQMSPADFDALLAAQPVGITKTGFEPGDPDLSFLYPDALTVEFVNNTSEDIRTVELAFAAWDENNLPVKVRGQIDFSSMEYVKKVTFEDINLIPGQSYGGDNPYDLDSDVNASFCKAIVVSFETFDGDNWSNPYFNDFKSLYENKRYNEETTIEVKLVDDSFE